MGTSSSDDFESGTRAAAGIDMMLHAVLEVAEVV